MAIGNWEQKGRPVLIGYFYNHKSQVAKSIGLVSSNLWQWRLDTSQQRREIGLYWSYRNVLLRPFITNSVECGRSVRKLLTSQLIGHNQLQHQHRQYTREPYRLPACAICYARLDCLFVAMATETHRHQRCADPQISRPPIIRVRKHQVRGRSASTTVMATHVLGPSASASRVGLHCIQ